LHRIPRRKHTEEDAQEERDDAEEKERNDSINYSNTIFSAPEEEEQEQEQEEQEQEQEQEEAAHTELPESSTSNQKEPLE
jgi:hypothetical protein